MTGSGEDYSRRWGWGKKVYGSISTGARAGLPWCALQQGRAVNGPPGISLPLLHRVSGARPLWVVRNREEPGVAEAQDGDENLWW
ncbi:hypothetical protein CEXT_690581 [Caerostris extrusa]|uniref:Uncharacterized protein n=1 Tax=Caerostris extrusa TaxID=172846 RepID=A0AAV4MLL5_CAEEX|nr:hypothetical protein CEXT_690581 [Caerostris extrusa]